MVCLSKEMDGLGIKDIASFNMFLLLNWKWRFITDGWALWKGILEHRYLSPLYNLVMTILCNDGDGGRKNDSILWQDIIALGFDKEKSLHKFFGNIIDTFG